MIARLTLVLLALLPFAAVARADAVAQAERSFAAGDVPRALAVLRAPAKRRQPRALTVRGRILLARGEREQAEQDLYAVIELYNAGKIGKRDADSLWAVAEAAWLLGAYRNANEAFSLARAVRPHHADIDVAHAALYFEKHDLHSAEQCLKAALDHAPHACALELLARVRLEQGATFAEVEALLDRALELDPKLARVHTSRAGLALRDENLQAADAALDRALSLAPHDLTALSVRAAVRFVAGDAAGFANAVSAVLRENPRYAQLYSVVADYAEWEHRYPELVELADAALRIDPTDASAHATRGLNLLRIGREAEGRSALREAFQRDPYEQRVFNTLNLYEQVIDVSYESQTSAPFLIRLHRDERNVLEPYLSRLLTRAFDSMVQRYGIRPAAPIHVELFASERDFAVRTSGMPRLHIQGVCFGNTIVAVSPSATEVNWGQVVWHELSHVFHVALSRGRIPRWLTEGLAEHETERARSEWKREDDRPLWDALRSEQLPHLDQLNQAFTHARDPETLMVAYYASARAAAFLHERFGEQAVAKLVRGYGEGLGTEQLFERELGMSLANVDQAFRASELARLSAKYAHDFRADPREPQGPFAAAHEALRAGQLVEARAALQRMFDAGHDGYQLRMLLARTLHKLGDDLAALSQLDAASKLDPDRVEAYELMATLAVARKDGAHLAHALERWSLLDQHARKPLAAYLALLAAKGDYAALLPRAEAGLFVDPANSELHRQHGLALAHAGRVTEAHAELARAFALARDKAQRDRVLESQRALQARTNATPKTPRRAAERAVSR